MKRFCIALLILGIAQAAASAGLRAGTGTVKITPPRGAPLAGYYYNRAADGVHDELWAKTLVLEEGAKKVALVACDIINLPRPIVEEARRLIARDSGIPADAVMIGATHTHTGPVLLLPGSRYNLEGEMLRIAEEYTAELPGRIAESVRLACAGLRDARPAAGRGREDALPFNRRFHMKDGTVGWNPGKLNPGIVRPAGPIDPDVPVVYFETPDAAPLAVYVNYAMHQDTTGGTNYSADYAGVLARLLRDVRGSGLMTLFTIGCAGNVNHYDVGWADRQTSPGEAARIGTILAAEVLKVLNHLESVPSSPLRAQSALVPLELPRVSEEEVAWASKVTPTFGRPDAAPFLDLVRAYKIAEVAARQGKPLEAEVQVIAMGKDVAWVGLPGEIFTELGLAIKAASPFRTTLVAGLSNDSLGYIPNLKAYDEGNYEVESARCGPGSGEKLVETAVRLLVDLHREK